MARRRHKKKSLAARRRAHGKCKHGFRKGSVKCLKRARSRRRRRR
jgi:hypothetical protein